MLELNWNQILFPNNLFLLFGLFFYYYYVLAFLYWVQLNFQGWDAALLQPGLWIVLINFCPRLPWCVYKNPFSSSSLCWWAEKGGTGARGMKPGQRFCPDPAVPRGDSTRASRCLLIPFGIGDNWALGTAAQLCVAEEPLMVWIVSIMLLLKVFWSLSDPHLLASFCPQSGGTCP